MDTGDGDDSILLDLAGIIGPEVPLPEPDKLAPALDIDIATGDGADNVTATVQDISIDLHLNADLGSGNDSFTVNILPDSQLRLAEFSCDAIAVIGGGGADT